MRDDSASPGPVSVTELNISGTVFAYSCLVLVLIGLSVAGASLAWAISAAKSADETYDQLDSCRTSLLRVEGRLSAFENVFVSAHQFSVETSLKSFMRDMGPKLSASTTLKEYEQWLNSK